jgi:2,5-dioxopentanoate dehydrogenase
MSKIWLIGIFIPLTLLGIAAAGTIFSGSLANVSYIIHGNSNTSSDTILPANINLGNLTAGQSGNYSAVASMEIHSPGYYKFELNNYVLKGEFSNFTAVIKFANYTVILTSDHHNNNDHHHNNNDHHKAYSHDEEKVYLQPGNYSVTIYIYYQVSNYAHNMTVNGSNLITVYEEDNS